MKISIVILGVFVIALPVQEANADGCSGNDDPTTCSHQHSNDPQKHTPFILPVPFT